MIFKSKHFPFVNQIKTKEKLAYKNIVILALGANIKNCIKTFENLFFTLKRNANIFIHSTSFIYKNKAFGFTKQNDFYNSAIIILTNLSLRNVFSYIFYLERKFGRKRIRDFKNAPRTLDIDMIFFNNMKVNYYFLQLPHSDYKNRMSVLLPLGLQFSLFKSDDVI